MSQPTPEIRPPASEVESREQPAAIRAVVIDDQSISRTAIVRFLADGGIEVAGTASSAAGGLDAVVDHVPDVAIVDLGLPDFSGMELTRRLRECVPATGILVITASESRSDVIESFRAGAIGYLQKSAAEVEIVGAVQAVANGEVVLGEQIAKGLIEVIRDTPAPLPHEASDDGFASDVGLTDRELQILRLIAAGKENPEIAAELHVSPFTVKNHVANILAKLQLDNRIQAAVHAVRRGLA